MKLRDDPSLDIEQLENDIDLAYNVTKEELEHVDFQRAMLRMRSDYGLYL